MSNSFEPSSVAMKTAGKTKTAGHKVRPSHFFPPTGEGAYSASFE